MIRKTFVAILAIVLTTGSAMAQGTDYRLQQTLAPSASENLYCIYFDRDGQLWVGTDMGVRWTDGYRVKTYRADASTPDMLPNNTVHSLVEDGKGRLWIGTRNGLVRMDKHTGEHRTYHLPLPQQRIIYSLFCAHDGTLWIGTDGGLTRYIEEEDSFYTYEPSNMKCTDTEGNPVKIGGYNVKSIAEDKEGNLYIGTWSSGLLRLHPRKDSCFVQYPKLNPRNSAFALSIDSHDRLWVSTWDNGLVRIDHPLDAADMTIRHIAPDSFSIYYRIVEDTMSGTIWACSPEGVSMVRTDDEEVVPTNFRYLSGQIMNFCDDLATDGRGNVWVGTMNDGVFHISTTDAPFKMHQLALEKPMMEKCSVSSIFTADGRHFWLGMYPNGIASYDRLTGMTLTGSDNERLRNVGKLLYEGAIGSIIQLPNGEIWMANSYRGIIVLPPKGQARVIDRETGSFVFDNCVNTLFLDSQGRVWVGQRGGISVVGPDHRGGRLTMGSDSEDFSNCDVRGIAEDHEGNVWIATRNEGIICARRDGTFRHYCTRLGNMVPDDVTGCLEDSRHLLWAISASGGLFRYYPQDDCFKYVHKLYHLNGSGAFAIGEDSEQRLWVSTEQSVERLTFAGIDEIPQVTRFSRADGIGQPCVMPNAIFRWGDELLLGTRQGFYSCDIRSSAMEPLGRPRLVVTDIYADDTPLDELAPHERQAIASDAPLYTRSISLPASVSKVSVEFALLSYYSQEQNKYAYRLDGYDDEWRQGNALYRRATFENLPPGKYTLHLKAADSHGEWTELPYTISVRVLPPWYLSWWMWIIYLLTTASVILSIIYQYKRHLMAQNQRQMNNALTNITHELLTPLSVIQASVDELHVQAPEHEAAYGVMQNNITRVTRLLRQILEVTKGQEGRLRLEVAQGDLTDFVGKCCDNVRPMAIAAGLQLTTELHQVTGLFDTDKVDKMLYNLLSNAIKYSREGGTVSVKLSADDDGDALLSVADQGIGIAREKMKHLYSRFFDGDYRMANAEGTGLGLSLTHDLVTLHHGTIDCQSQQGRGTTFTITLPIRREAYTESEMARGDASAAAIAPPAGRALPSSRHKEYTLLIVEDNDELLGMMQRLLSQHYHVLTARNGQQALGIIRRRDLDVVISDVMMPVMDGIELTRTIKNSDDYAQLPVILLTAKTRDEDRDEAFATGADEYITKPFRLQSLQLRVDNIIQNRERIRRSFSSQTDFNVEDQHYSSPDRLFVERAIQCVKDHLHEYDREQFARDMCVSSSTLYNKLRALTGQSISAFITSVRMKEACRIARQNSSIRVAELGMAVGISTPKYFTKCFKEEFGMLPSEYIASLEKQESASEKRGSN